MKIKSEFVTNSSSSSFVVAFTKKITSIEDIMEYIPQDAKALQVYKDAKNQKPIKITTDAKSKAIKRMAKEMRGGHLSGTPGYTETQRRFCEREEITVNDLHKNRNWSQAFWKEYELIGERNAVEKAVNFARANEGSYIYFFYYGDEDGEFFSEMEHGGTFQNLPHVTISNH